jgi:hypothetical protein
MRRNGSFKWIAVAAIAGASLLAGCAGAPGTTYGSARSDAIFGRIQPGTTEEEVRQLVGPPDEAMPFPATRTHAWSYRYYDTWGFAAEFSVTFDANGRTVSTFSKRIGYGGGGRN